MDMLTRAERGILWGAWLLIAGTVAVGTWTISRRPEAPQPRAGRRAPEAPPRDDSSRALELLRREPPRAIEGNPWTCFLTPVLVERPCDPRIREVLILPEAHYSGTGNLDGVTLAWTLRERTVPLQPWERAKRSPPAGFAVERDGVRVAVLGPKVVAYVDTLAEPGRTYRYAVVVLGRETLRDQEHYPEVEVEIDREEPLEVAVPANFRVRLVGGVDAKIAFLRIETYNRERKRWVSSDHRVRPGEGVPGTDWTLEALRFDGFTLAADVTDGNGVPRTLSTKE
jgi:hypothetical protein